jgi:predicted nucleic acid-binding protein
MYLGFLLNDLDLGEAEALLLAAEINADVLIIDERLGYQMAKSKGINAIGTLTVLLMAKQQGIIESVKPLLDDMIQKGRWYSHSVYDNFLKQIGEL